MNTSFSSNTIVIFATRYRYFPLKYYFIFSTFAFHFTVVKEEEADIDLSKEYWITPCRYYVYMH